MFILMLITLHVTLVAVVIAFQAFQQRHVAALNKIWPGRKCIEATKIRLYDTMIVPIAICVCIIWTMIDKHEKMYGE